MNSKAIKRQLLAAIAMVLVAAIALGSSTYAWFVASGTVTATGMKVTAQADAGLAIRYGSDGLWGTTASAGMENGAAKVLYPASTADVKTWYHATAEIENNFKAVADTRTDITKSVLGETKNRYVEGNQYVVMKTFEIRSTSPDQLSAGLYVTDVTATIAKQHAMNTALRVAVEYVDASNNSTVKFFGPVSYSGNNNQPSDNYNVYKYVPAVDATGSTQAAPAKEEIVGTVSLATPNVKIQSEAKNAIIIGEGVKIPYSKGEGENATAGGLFVNIYIWFEGEDHNLTSTQFVADDVSVSVSFSNIGTASNS